MAELEIIDIAGKDDTPNVKLDPKKGFLEFSGKSFPDDVKVFYSPIVAWVDKYVLNPNEKTEIHFKFHYFNTASSKMILEILDRLYKIKEAGKNLEVNWYYKQQDEDMLIAGEEYSSIVDIPFNYIPT